MSTAPLGTPAATEPAPAADPRRWKALGVLALGLALIVIDGSIVSVALPDIISDLRLDITDAQWVNSLYAVVFSALLLLSGRLGDRLGRRTLFIAGIIVFVGASVWAACVGSGAGLITARLVQGIGGALIMPATLSTVNATFRGKERAAAFGVWGAVMSGAAALGPLLGGWLTSSFSWRWIFLVNVPIGLAVIVGGLLWVANTRSSTDGARHEGIDILGAVLSGLALGSIVFGIIEATTLGWWTQGHPLHVLGYDLNGPAGMSLAPIMIGLGAVLLIAFILWEAWRAQRGRSVLLDLSLFRLATFSWGNLTAMTVAVGEFGLLFVLPLYLVDVLGLSTLHAGFVLAAMALGAFFSGASARHVADRFGAPATVIIGLALEVAGVLTLGFILGPDTSPWMLVPVLMVYGVGLGLASAQLTSTVLADVPTDQSGQGSATQSTVRQLGTALGASIAGALLAGGLSAGIADMNGQAAQLAHSVKDSAGAALMAFRDQHLPNALFDPLLTMFTDASRWSIFGAAIFLALGLIGAIQVARVARRSAHADVLGARR
ncbi:DHA2 family efflux MFS transporter permease subunit [Devriesea agamarum]|uniref:DHA2 family efflux MFS transporter permease subunit n=1 Tax=Devriesea agamarum TaxID=472569 RepID=UPI00071C88B8|nr:DHA2 family efflux MFS transporter permease subunit [Devriesea agamarum]